MNDLFKQMWKDTPVAFKLWWAFCAVSGMTVTGLVVWVLIKLVAKL